MEALIALLLIAIVVLAAGAWMYSRQQRSKKLQENFGPEYERALRQTDRDKEQGRTRARRAPEADREIETPRANAR